MNRPTNFSRKTLQLALSSALLALASGSALADNAITFQGWGNGAGASPDLNAGGSLSVTKTLLQSNYSDNPSLAYSAWAHAGGTPWYTFHLTSSSDVSINLTPVTSTANFNPGITVWASGASKFNGGTADQNELASNGWNAPHSFNAVGQIGDAGTGWSSGSNGNQLETLAYAVTGPSHTDTSTTGWGETILTGVHDVSIDNTFESGVSGTALGNSISLNFSGLQAGWYTVFIGGTNNALTSASYSLSVNAVPEPETYALLLAGLGVLGTLARRRRNG